MKPPVPQRTMYRLLVWYVPYGGGEEGAPDVFRLAHAPYVQETTNPSLFSKMDDNELIIP